MDVCMHHTVVIPHVTASQSLKKNVAHLSIYKQLQFHQCPIYNNVSCFCIWGTKNIVGSSIAL